MQIVSEAVGQGVTITGDNHRNSWDWGNSVIFAATIVTTIGLYEVSTVFSTTTTSKILERYNNVRSDFIRRNNTHFILIIINSLYF